MRTLVIGLAAAMVMAHSAAHAASMPLPLEPAAHGKLECDDPDPSKKTCHALTAYQQAPDGAIQSLTQILIAPSPLIIMSNTTRVDARDDGQLCTVLRQEDLATANFTIDGQPADPDRNQRLRAALIKAMAGLFGRRACISFVPDGDGFIQRSVIEGMTQPVPDQKMIWVAPDSGYQVAP